MLRAVGLLRRAPSGFLGAETTALCSRFKSSVPDEATLKQKLPDYNTSINIHEHKLARPTKPPPKREKLKEFLSDTRGSLIPDTLKEMEADDEFQKTLKDLKTKGQVKMTREERKKRQRALNNLGIPRFLQTLRKQRTAAGLPEVSRALNREVIDTMGLNIGIYCNQACSHCHVESSPKRKEMMNHVTAQQVVKVMENSPHITRVDITGGAPELCQEFRYLVESSSALGKEVIDRCNLTALLEPGQEDTAEFLAKHKVHVVASLPCYSAKNVNMQRGSGVFNKSIHALLMLNDLGYGKPGTGMVLDLVYNPLGAYLPPPQAELRVKYREELWEMFGIEFNELFTLTNMPIKRFADFLYRRNELEEYMSLLVRNFNLDTVDKLMCKNVLNVNYEGTVYDCDFNSQLDIGIAKNGKYKFLDRGDGKTKRVTIWDLESTECMHDLPIMTDNHCFGCTAGMGSS